MRYLELALIVVGGVILAFRMGRAHMRARSERHYWECLRARDEYRSRHLYVVRDQGERSTVA